MVRGPIDLKRHADTVNGRRDRLLGRRVGEHFSKAGYQFQLDTEIRGDGDQTDVDVILYQSRRPNEVLIVEAKAVIAPDEISEVFDATKTIQGAQGQLQRAISIIRSMAPRELRERFKFIDWDLVRDLRGIVITSDAEAYSTVDQRQFPSITYEMLLYRFRSSHFKSPVHFWRAAIERPWQKGEVVAGQDIVHRDVLIGEITYRLPACSVEVDMDRNGIGKLDRVVQIHAK
jgi:hypothetical protein